MAIWKTNRFSTANVSLAYRLVLKLAGWQDLDMTDSQKVMFIGYILDKRAKLGDAEFIGSNWEEVTVRPIAFEKSPRYRESRNADNYHIAGCKVLGQLGVLLGIATKDNPMPATVVMDWIMDGMQDPDHPLHNTVYQLAKDAKLVIYS